MARTPETQETGTSGSGLRGCLPVPLACLAQVPRHVPASAWRGPRPGRRSLPKRRSCHCLLAGDLLH